LVATDVRLVQRHDATELVKIRFNIASGILRNCDYCFRSFTGTADTYTPAANYGVTGVTFRIKMRLART
jgi:hypothetical protein